MNRADFQQLADDRIHDAEALLAAGRWSAAYYLAGYAVECALKACIAKLTNQYDFPNKKLALDSYTHEIDKLVAAAELKLAQESAVDADPILSDNWLEVGKWTEASRYQQWSQPDAERLFAAITDNPSGVMQWIKCFW